MLLGLVKFDVSFSAFLVFRINFFSSDLRSSDLVTKLCNYSSSVSEQIYLFSGSYYMFRRRSNAMKIAII